MAVIDRQRRCCAPLICLLIASTFTNAPRAASCDESSGQGAVDLCGSELSQNPTNVKTRQALASALMKLGRLQEAVAVLKQGVAIDPTDPSLQSRLTEAQDALKEQAWIASQREKQSSVPSNASDTTTKLNIIRCSKLQGAAALSACNAGLEKLPHDVVLLTGKADALLSLNRLAEAVAGYQRALTQKPGNVELQSKLKTAQAKQQLAVTRCKTLAGSAGLAACSETALQGAMTPAAVAARRGDILLEMKQPAKALDAYQKAQKLDRGNAHVKKALAQLNAATLSEPNADTAAPEPLSPTARAPAPEVTVTTVPAPRYTNAALAPGVTY